MKLEGNLGGRGRYELLIFRRKSIAHTAFNGHQGNQGNHTSIPGRDNNEYEQKHILPAVKVSLLQVKNERRREVGGGDYMYFETPDPLCQRN